MPSGPGRGAFCPNGLEIVHLNSYETDYVYKEIFEDQCYLRHGIRLQDGLRYGYRANIGLFSLFVMSRLQEPQDLRLRTGPGRARPFEGQLRCLRVECAGVERRRVGKRKTATFTFY